MEVFKRPKHPMRSIEQIELDHFIMGFWIHLTLAPVKWIHFFQNNFPLKLHVFNEATIILRIEEVSEKNVSSVCGLLLLLPLNFSVEL